VILNPRLLSRRLVNSLTV